MRTIEIQVPDDWSVLCRHWGKELKLVFKAPEIPTVYPCDKCLAESKLQGKDADTVILDDPIPTDASNERVGTLIAIDDFAEDVQKAIRNNWFKNL